MVFNYDKATGKVGSNKNNLENALTEVKDFFLKKQDIEKPYTLSKDEYSFFERMKKELSDSQLNGSAEDSKDAMLQLAEEITGADSSWNVVLRYTEAADGNPPVTTKNYLAMGDKGDAVKTMQTMLIKLGYSCGKYGADGDFGSGSLASVKAFQRDNGLVADGLYGEATKAKLTTLYNAKIKAESAPKPSSKPSIASSSKVASAQSFNKSIAGTYKVKASNGLNLRYKPGDTSNSNLIITIPNGKSVANYGYYTTVNGVKWYLVTYKDTPGFVSSRYLVK